MKKNKGEIYKRIKNKIIKDLRKEILKVRNKRQKELKSLPDNYTIKHYRIRENECDTMYNLFLGKLDAQCEEKE